MAENSIFSLAKGGIAFTGAARGLNIVFRLGVVAILARLLSPDDFGVFNAGMIFIGFVDVIAFIGVGPAIVQRRNLETSHLRTGLTVSLCMGIILMLALIVAHREAATLLGSATVQGPLLAMALLFPVKAYALVATSLLRRDLKFKSLAVVETAAFAVGYCFTAITLALLGWGYWALYAATAAQVVFGVIATLLVSKQKVVPGFSLSAFRDMFHFSLGTSIARIFNYSAQKGDYFVISRTLGTEPLGLYNRAYAVMEIPVATVVSTLDQVLFPLFARTQDNKEELRRALVLMTQMSFAIFGLASAFLVILSHEIVWILLGREWLEIVPTLKVLGVALVFRACYKFPDSVSRATGHVYKFALTQLLYAALVIGGAFWGSRHGIFGVACGVSIALVVNFFAIWALASKAVNAARLGGLFLWLRSLPAALCCGLGMEVSRRFLYSLGWDPVLVGVAAASLGVGLVMIQFAFFPRFIIGNEWVQMLKKQMARWGAAWNVIRAMPGWRA